MKHFTQLNIILSKNQKNVYLFVNNNVNFSFSRNSNFKFSFFIINLFFQNRTIEKQ